MFLYTAHYPGPDGIPPDSHLQAYKKYLQHDWSDLAAIAWAYYEKKGRGVIRLSMRTLQKVLEDQDGPVLWDIPTPYHPVPELEGWEEEFGLPASFVEELSGLVKNYDPSSSLVVYLGRIDGGASLYVMSSEPTPPEALALKDRMN